MADFITLSRGTLLTNHVTGHLLKLQRNVLVESVSPGLVRSSSVSIPDQQYVKHGGTIFAVVAVSRPVEDVATSRHSKHRRSSSGLYQVS